MVFLYAVEAVRIRVSTIIKFMSSPLRSQDAIPAMHISHVMPTRKQKV